MRHGEKHNAHRIGWLRASVLGANDGIVSTASLVMGVVAADAARGEVLTAGVAGLVAGAMSMAAGEYVSVSSQADTERADLEQERRELRASPVEEAAELADIYVSRGLDPELAKQVSAQLTAHDALGAHARDELGISPGMSARPVQAAVSSATAFSIGATLPLGALALVPLSAALPVVAATSLVSLALLGAMSARAGRARVSVAMLRVTFWGALAMALTAGIGALFGTIV